MFIEAPKVDLTSLFGAKEIRVKAGEPLKLALGITGSPTPTVTWTKGGKPVDRVHRLLLSTVTSIPLSRA